MLRDRRRKESRRKLKNLTFNEAERLINDKLQVLSEEWATAQSYK